MSDSPAEGLDLALKKMGTDYVDLYLLHSPFVSKEVNGLSLEEAWKDMEQLYKSGKAKNIGVSNFAVEDLQRILKVAEVKPQVNQIEFSPFLQNQTPGIYKFCQEHDILLEAYSPLGPLQKKTAQDDSQPFFEYVKELSEKYIKSEAQIILRWVTKRGVLPVTTSSKPQRISDAQNLFSFDLTAEEVDKITELGLEHEPLRLYWNKLYGKYNYAAQKYKYRIIYVRVIFVLYNFINRLFCQVYHPVTHPATFQHRGRKRAVHYIKGHQKIPEEGISPIKVPH